MKGKEVENMLVFNKPIEKWKEEYPILSKILELEECFWINPGKQPFQEAVGKSKLTMEDILDAEARLNRFAPYFEAAFPETIPSKGILESPLRTIPDMQQYLSEHVATPVLGRMLLKCDSHLPISGSIKARGGIYEVLKFAEDVALSSGMLKKEDDYSVLLQEPFRALFSKYSVAVGSTGNLGLSIGIISAKLGFRVTVHMSADARQWKKDMLRQKGVTVVEYDSDYSLAVKEGRRQAESDPMCHFVDDENSSDLFLGYAVAGLRLKKQLEENGIFPDQNHPLFVYLPCGVGGGPGGVAFGLKQIYGDAVHCFFAEPTHSPCMMLGLLTGLHDKICVQDIGIDNKTIADGLAVGRPSKFVGRIIEPHISGSYSVTDDHLYELMSLLKEKEQIALEPSALAGMTGPWWLCCTEEGRQYQKENKLTEVMEQAVHIVWATGGSMVPREEMERYYENGKRLREEGKR